MSRTRLSFPKPTTTIQFLGSSYNIAINEERYRDGNALALEAIDVNDGSPFGTITVNIPGHTLADGEIIVKTWSENEWVRQLLTLLPDTFKDTGRRVNTGYVQAEIWTYKKR